MTRESKLALIIGLAFFLVVSILISDHFSSASTSVPISIEPARANAQAAAHLMGVAERSIEDAPLQLPAPPTPDPEEEAPPQSPPTPEIRMDPPLAGPESVVGSGGAPAATPAVSGHDPVGGFQPSSPTSTPEIRLHHVKSGESLTSIARQHYNNASLWKELAAFNKDRVGPDGSVREGVTLAIPPLELLNPHASPSQQPAAKPKAVPKSATPSGPTAIAANKPAKPTANKPKHDADTRLYVVRPNENLGKISADLLGTSKRWPEILALNADRISDPDDIQAGMKLRVPVR